MAVFLGLLVAASYGSGDFLGGLASRTSPPGATVLVSQAFAALVAVPVAVVWAVAAGTSAFSGHDAVLSIAAGLVTVAGLACLYRGLALGRASVVAPTSAVGAAVLQVGWGLANGEDPGTVAMIGVALALVAVGLVAASAGTDDSSGTSRWTELALGAGAAVLLGSNLILLSETGSDSGLWPIALGRVAALPVVAVALLALRRPFNVRREDMRFVAGAGALDASANVLQLIAVREALLTLVAPVAALYPAATVLLARIWQGERIGRARSFGLLVALVSLGLIAVR